MRYNSSDDGKKTPAGQREENCFTELECRVDPLGWFLDYS